MRVCASVLWRRRRVQCQATALLTCDGVLGRAAGCSAVRGAAGTCRARRTAACATFASTRARGSLRPVLTGMYCCPSAGWSRLPGHTACGLPDGKRLAQNPTIRCCLVRHPCARETQRSAGFSWQCGAPSSRRNEEGGPQRATDNPPTSPTAPTTTTTARRWRFGGVEDARGATRSRALGTAQYAPSTGGGAPPPGGRTAWSCGTPCRRGTAAPRRRAGAARAAL